MLIKRRFEYDSKQNLNQSRLDRISLLWWHCCLELTMELQAITAPLGSHPNTLTKFLGLLILSQLCMIELVIDRGILDVQALYPPSPKMCCIMTSEL